MTKNTRKLLILIFILSFATPVTLEVPTREGYEFCGWFDNETFSGIPLSDTVSFSDTHESYYALWKEVN